MLPVRTGRRSIVAVSTRDLEAPATTMVTGSELVTINRWQARAWERAITAAYPTQDMAPPLGWNPTGRHGAPVGYDLVLATPQTLSALSWCMFGSHRDVSDDINQAHSAAAQGAAVEFSTAIGAETLLVVGHLFDSQGQPWSHWHVICGALSRPASQRPGWSGPQRGSEVWLPLDHETVVRMAGRFVFGYHLLLRRALTPMVRELGLNWEQLAPDGSCEVWGLTAPVLECISLPARPLGEIHACRP
jgi:hypothetical protein